ncbi:MAG: ABC transporter permease [Acetobacter sp.]
MRYHSALTQSGTWSRFTAIVGLVTIIAPVCLIIVSAFSLSPYHLLVDGVTLKWFDRLFHNERLIHAFLTSLKIAICTTLLALVVALPTAFAVVRCRFRGQGALLAILELPMMLPGVVVGLAGLSTLLQTGIVSRNVPMILALLSVMVPLMLRPVTAALRQTDPSLESAARNLGASHVRVLLLVTLPQLAPAVIAASLFCFVETLDNFAITAFLSDLRTTTLPIESYSYIRDFDDPVISAVSAVLTAFGFFLAVCMDRIISVERFVDIA